MTPQSTKKPAEKPNISQENELESFSENIDFLSKKVKKIRTAPSEISQSTFTLFEEDPASDADLLQMKVIIEYFDNHLKEYLLRFEIE